MSSQASASVVEYVPKQLSFLDGAIDLKPLQRTIKRHTQAAIDAMVNVIESTKDEQLKARTSAKLVELYVQIAKEINDDQLKRLVAEIKMNQASQMLLPSDQANRPLVDFGTIAEV